MSDVKKPGVRGGKFYYDHEGKVVYGSPPEEHKVPKDTDIIQQYMPIIEGMSSKFAARYGGTKGEYISSAYLGALASLKSNNLDNVSIGTNMKMYVFKYLREHTIDQKSVVKQVRDRTESDSSLHASVGDSDDDISYIDLLEDDRPNPYEEYQSGEKADHAKKMMEVLQKELPPKELIVFNMIVIDGASFEEAGKAIGHSNGTVFNYLAKARLKIEKLKEEGKLFTYEEDADELK